jgi:hypothetical protein
VQSRQPEAPKGGSTLVSYGLLVGILAVIATVYVIFIAPMFKKEPITPAVSAVVVPEAPKHVRHSAHPGGKVRTHNPVAADSVSGPRGPQSMKLWQSTDDQ